MLGSDFELRTVNLVRQRPLAEPLSGSLIYLNYLHVMQDTETLSRCHVYRRHVRVQWQHNRLLQSVSGAVFDIITGCRSWLNESTEGVFVFVRRRNVVTAVVDSTPRLRRRFTLSIIFLFLFSVNFISKGVKSHLGDTDHARSPVCF